MSVLAVGLAKQNFAWRGMTTPRAAEIAGRGVEKWALTLRNNRQHDFSAYSAADFVGHGEPINSVVIIDVERIRYLEPGLVRIDADGVGNHMRTFPRVIIPPDNGRVRAAVIQDSLEHGRAVLLDRGVPRLHEDDGRLLYLHHRRRADGL